MVQIKRTPEVPLPGKCVRGPGRSLYLNQGILYANQWIGNIPSVGMKVEDAAKAKQAAAEEMILMVQEVSG